MQIFTVVICFGLFHGLVFLPVLLSLIGPQPYMNTQVAKEELAIVAGRKASVELRPLANGHGSTLNGHTLHASSSSYDDNTTHLNGGSDIPPHDEEESSPTDKLNGVHVQS
jgi:hypothetical protein